MLPVEPPVAGDTAELIVASPLIAMAGGVIGKVSGAELPIVAPVAGDTAELATTRGSGSAAAEALADADADAGADAGADGWPSVPSGWLLPSAAAGTVRALSAGDVVTPG